MSISASTAGVPTAPAVLFAGGGSGGHVMPNLAIAERLRELGVPHTPIFVVSNRPLDAEICRQHGVECEPIPVQPPVLSKPQRWLGIARSWLASVGQVKRLIAERRVAAVVSTGGFVSGPVVMAARKLGVPTALVSLDAVPGRANATLAHRATQVFAVYPTPKLGNAQSIGFPLRRSVIGSTDKAESRRTLGLDPNLNTLFITGASQGAVSMNRMMIEWLKDGEARNAIAGWQVLHQSGDKDVEELRAAYDAAGVPARVEPFITNMGLAWSAANLAISRAAAGSVAEAVANAVPAIYLPYPYHRDEHQRLNAEPIVKAGGGVLLRDQIDGAANARQIHFPLIRLLSNPVTRQQMTGTLREHAGADGAADVARWLANRLK